jgi:hypothetical protein
MKVKSNFMRILKRGPYHPKKEPTYENGNSNGFWFKFKKDEYWIYRLILCFMQSLFFYYFYRS